MITISNPARNDLDVGTIILWYGLATEVPTGWAVCNGSNGTPDLRGIYVKGALWSTNVGVTGGATTHIHTVGSTGDAGNHTHSYSLSTSNNVDGTTATSGTVSRSKISHGHSASGTTQGGGTHSHGMSNTNTASSHPPYHRLWYIMRIG